MNPVHLVTITLNGAIVFQFVTPDDFDRAGYLAGEAMDAMADLSPPEAVLDYKVTPVPYAGTMVPLVTILRAARDATS